MNQKSITSFFNKIPIGLNRQSKRSLSENENFDSLNVITEEKKIKLDEAVNSDKLNGTHGDQESDKSFGDCENGPVISKGTMDLATKIEINRLSAELKLLSKALPALHPNMGISWFKALRPEFDKPYIKKLSKFIAEERSRTTPTFPSPDKVWTWTRECEIGEVKTVILGQDPYHHPGQAHGLSFSVPVGVPPPPSLLNIYKELESDIEGFKRPGHGNLIGWARQGVLLLNAVLTVRCRSPNSHKDQGWEKLTDAVIKHLNTEGRGIVFLLWGSYAQKKAEFVDQKKHYLLKSVHPSPLSASRGFLGCRHFSKCNELLESEEQQRENDKALRKAGRDIERDRRQLEKEEKKLELEIKRLAAQGNHDGCKLLAKQLIQMRKQRNRTFAANSKIQSIGAQNKAMGANISLANAMSTTAKTMKDMNSIMKPEQVAADMRAFSQANMKMDMTDEMINDTLDDLLNESGDEEESDLIVNQVLDEIGIEISGKMAKAPSAASDKLGEHGKSRLPTDEEIEEQLAKLRA